MTYPPAAPGTAAPAMHPTVPYGQPGAPAAVVLPPTAPVPTASQAAAFAAAAPPAPPAQPGFYGAPPQAPAQPAQPAPQGTFPAGTQPPYMGGQPGQQPQQQQQQEQVRIPDNFVLDGPNVPPELRGRTWGQVRQVYGALAQEFIGQRPGAVPAPRPNMPGAPAPQAPQAPQRTAAPQPPQEGDRIRTFWEDPLAAIERVVDQRLAPVTQRTAAMAVQDAKNMAVSAIPDFAVLEAEMIPTLRAAPPELLADPNFWISTADLTRGRLMGAGRYDPRAAAPRQPQAPQAPQYPQPGPGVSVPAHSFFTEAPTPPSPNGFNGGNPNQWELTPEQKMYAQKMHMTEQEYRDWSGGVQRPTQARRMW